MSDEGFHEIQLNGKQLVFLFMAATVVSVVIFLLGVMVGRGVPTVRAQATEIASGEVIDPTATVETSAGSPSSNADRVPVSAQESLTYAERLAAPTPARDTLKDPTEPPPARTEAPVARRADPPQPARAPATAAVSQTVTFAEPTGDGHVVQVGAYPRPTAETIAKRLSSKGYPVFIKPRPQGLFAVRVGKYGNKREADEVAGRLEQQEQFNKPWVTR
jgi:septal ring-binding cell division protein DamX